jgi:hypothetical protein
MTYDYVNSSPIVDASCVRLHMTYDQETVRTLYKKLLTLYPRGFREQLGESMEQTFADLCNERKRQTQPGWFAFVLWILL